MKRWITASILSLALTLTGFSARADFNLVNIDVGAPEAQRTTSLYGQAYGFQPVQVAPIMSAPPQEVPAILQMAQAAGTLPMSIFMLRQAGMNYGQIMQQFAVAPLVGMGQPVTNAYYVEQAQRQFLLERLRVDPILLPQIPLRGTDFYRFIAYPVHPKIGYWMPPGQAKKYGYWIPPGQAKKRGLWDGRWSHDRWRGWDWDDADWKDWDGPDWKSKDWKSGDSKGPGWKDHDSPGKGGKPDKYDQDGPGSKNAKVSKGNGNGGSGKGQGKKGGSQGGGNSGKGKKGK